MKFSIEFTPEADDDLKYWKSTNSIKILDKIKELLTVMQIDPFKGVRKPEPIKRNLTGYGSRRITQEHRLVYKITNRVITIVQCRFQHFIRKKY